MRLLVARCQVTYRGRLSTVLPDAVRLLMVKSDGTFMVWADGAGSSVRPLNWMAPPTVIDEQADEDGRLRAISVRSLKGGAKGGGQERLEVSVSEVLSDVHHELDSQSSLEKEGQERELQELLADSPGFCGEGFRLVRREWPTDIGPVDLMCRDSADEWIAVEVKRAGTIDAVEQLARYLERIRLDPALSSCRGVLAAQTIKPQALVLARSRGIDCVEVELEVIRGEREPELRLFAA